MIRPGITERRNWMTRILCLGDSITDCGRLFSADPLGKGYGEAALLSAS